MNMVPDLCVRHTKVPEQSYMYDLGRFLYVGAAGIDARWFAKKHYTEFGAPQKDRLKLLEAIKEQFETDLISGASLQTIRTRISTLSMFFQFIDRNRLCCSLEKVESTFLSYSEYLFQEVNKKPAHLKKATAYGYASHISTTLGRILDIPEAVSLIKRTRLKLPASAKKALSKGAEKQNLHDTFRLGRFLVEVSGRITVESVYEPLPLMIPISTGIGDVQQVRIGCGTRELPDNHWFYSKPRDQWDSNELMLGKRMEQLRQSVNTIDGSQRWQLINLRVMAEFLIFVAQTGMNKTQAEEMKREGFKFKSLGDSWEVKGFKRRRGGEVSFKIYKSYKPYFQKYRLFLNHFFPDSDDLFPVMLFGKCLTTTFQRFQMLKRVLKENGIPWIPPNALRNTRVNWLLRRSGDEDLSADMAQHTREVLRDKYELPSQQRTAVEITRFWMKHDPIKQGELRGSVIAGRCNGKPEALDSKPPNVVEPNCISPSGCLWCKHFRDVDTQDYVWSLMSMRYLKILEASKISTSETTPADLVVGRLSDKIDWFRKSTRNRTEWVEEAELRIEEGHFHPNWSAIIEFLE